MKAVTLELVFSVIGVLIILLVIFWLIVLWRGAYFEKSLEALKKFKTYRPYVFDIDDLLSDPDSFDASQQNSYFFSDPDSAFCSDLRDCIEMNIKKGKKCVISYKTRPGVSFDPDDVYYSILSCPIVDIKEKIGGGLGRKICKFDFNSISDYNKIREDNITLLDYQPYIHNCYIPMELGTANIQDKTDQINYLYSGRGNESGYDFKNGGMVRIVMTNVSVKDNPEATCSYSLYVCGQNAIAASEDETTVNVFKKIRNLPESELYYNETLVWTGPPKDYALDFKCWIYCTIFTGILAPVICPGICGPFPTLPLGYNIYGYHPRTYNFTFSGTYQNKEALIDTVDAGMWEWNKIHYKDEEAMKYFIDAYYPDIERVYFSYSPIVNISGNNLYGGNINFNQGCWDISYESSNIEERVKLLLDDDVFVDSKSLKHIFNFENLPFNINIGDKIRMVLGIKKVFITGKPYTYDFGFLGSGTTSTLEEVNKKYDLDLKSRTILVMDPITFCVD